MKASSLESLSRREVALLAAALLVPIPALAVSGLEVPLPGVVARGLASLVPGGTDQPGSRETSSTDVPAQADASQAAGPVRDVGDASARAREATGQAEGRPSRTGDGGSNGIHAPGAGGPPAGGGTPSGGNPEPGADPAGATSPKLPGAASIAPNAQAAKEPPDTPVAEELPDTPAANELRAQVSVYDDGVGVALGDDSAGAGAEVGASTSGDQGASAGVTTQDGTQAEVDAPLPFPVPVPSLPAP
jgi:hypothetical protein